MRHGRHRASPPGARRGGSVAVIRSWRRSGAGAALLLAVAGSASGAEIPQHYQAALERSPELAMAEGRLQASAAQASGAARWYKGVPQLGVGILSDAPLSDNGYSEQEYELATDVWLPGERQGARREADAAQRLAQADLEIARLEVAAQVRDAYWDLALAERLLRIEQEAARHATEGHAAVGRLVDGRESPPNDLELAIAVLAVRHREAAAAAARADTAAAALQRHTGVGRSAGVPERRPDGPAPEVAAAVEAHPLVRRAVAHRDMLVAAAARQSRDLGANPQVAVVMRRERPLEGAEFEESVGLRLTVPVGRAAESQVSRVEASAAAAAAERALARQREEVEASVRLARRALEVAVEGALLSRKQRDALGRVSAGVDLAYLEGDATFLEVQRAREVWLDSERQVAEAEVGADRALSALLQAEGHSP